MAMKILSDRSEGFIRHRWNFSQIPVEVLSDADVSTDSRVR